jgi:uncharacterized protein
MKIVGLEEHIAMPQLLDAWSRVPGTPEIPELGYGDAPLALRLRDKGARRLAEMDDQGVDVQGLSLSTPGVQNLAPEDAVLVAREVNDALSEIVDNNPTRFQAFAAVPTPAPEAAAAELERAVTKLGCRGAMLFGRTGTAHADAPQFDDLYGVADRLGAPLYFHPQTPVRAVHDAYYAGINPKVDFMFATFGVGWYYDLGVELLRLIFSGVFDRHPNLQVIVGHWGELVLFYLDHIASMQTLGLHLERPLAQYFRQNVWVTGSGTLSERYLRWTAEVVGTDRILYSSDYPFTYATGDPIVETSAGRARSFLERAPLTADEKDAIGSGNWKRLTACLPARSNAPVG